MMMQQLGFSVLSAPIAAVDRRALSQAWYSALHLAHDRPKQSALPKVRVATPAACANSRVHAPPPRAHAKQSLTISLHREHLAPRSRPLDVDRRCARSPLARKIERAFLHPARAATRATFAIDGTSARVHVSLQSTPRGLRLVAVCAPRVRDAVARALDEARYALAARGVVVDARVAE